MDAAQLPDLDSLDREALLALLVAHQEELRSLAASHEDQLRSLQAELEFHRQTLSQQDEQLRSRSEQIEHLKLMIEKLRRAMFGRKSEKIVVQLEQLELHLEELESAQAEMETAIENVSPAAAVKPRSPRKPLPEHLPREVVTHLPQGDCCSSCGGALRQFGEDVSEQLEYIPESFKVIRHVRPKFACRGCDRVVEAPAPSRPIERGVAGPGLLAHVLVSKFGDHLPLYRQSEIYARQGVEIERSTLAGGGAASELLPCSTRFKNMYSEEPSSTPMTRRSQCWHLVTARRRQEGSGPMFATTGLRGMTPRLPSGSPTRKIARASIRGNI
jgi:transposase